MVKTYQKKWRRITAVLPFYRGDQRTGSKIWYDDGSYEIVYARCAQIVKELAWYMNIDLTVIQQKAVAWTSGKRQRKLPVVLDRDLCFLALKCREENGRNTGTIGYVAVHHIDCVLMLSDERSRVLFQGEGRFIDIPQRRKTVLRQIALGWQLLACYLADVESRMQSLSEGRKEYAIDQV